VVIGGGFTGLWAAEHLTRRAPGIDVVLLEQDICGAGASGRNGGLATGWWDELGRLVDLFGVEGAVRTAAALGLSIRAIGEWCRSNGVDAWYRHGGYLMVAAAPAQVHALEAEVELARELGVGDELLPLSREEVSARCASPAFLGGVWMRDGATVQPARSHAVCDVSCWRAASGSTSRRRCRDWMVARRVSLRSRRSGTSGREPASSG
jgi:glycine/D-amino acid oxidase-like deaminating enzyme